MFKNIYKSNYLSKSALRSLLRQYIRCTTQTGHHKSTDSGQEWSDVEESNYKRSLKRVITSGFESETDQIQASLSELDIQVDDFENHLDGNLIPRGEITNATALRYQKDKSSYERKREFVDWKRVKCSGGKGGDGMICFMKLWCNPMAGPSGGDGGHGGHVVFEASHEVKSLESIKTLNRAEMGENGMSKDMHGKNAKHTYIYVPVGTFVKNTEGRIFADLDEEGLKFVAARGGTGGKGNHHFLSNTNRHPRVAEVGASGEENTWILEMKIMAHAGLVGFPNAGKSTLLNAISRAKPKVASYPFTTLKPHVGIIQYDDYEQLAVADLPGIIEDAHKNKGLGISFLRHIERCICLFYVIDISQDKPWQQWECLRNELEQYKKGLSDRPHAIVCNKVDQPHAMDNFNLFKEHLGDHKFKIIPISAKYGNNLAELLRYFRELYDLYNYNEDKKQTLKW